MLNQIRMECTLLCDLGRERNYFFSIKLRLRRLKILLKTLNRLLTLLYKFLLDYFDQLLKI